MSEKKEFNYSVNGLRGLCIFMVFIYHVYNSGMLPQPSYSGLYATIMHFLSTFRYGVEIFFMISGYVIIGSLRRHKSFLLFLQDRALRIFPTWVPLHIIGFIGGPFLARGIFEQYDLGVWVSAFFSNLFFLPPIIPFPLVQPAAWSLNYEWAFYLIAGVTTFYFAGNKKTMLPLILVFSALLICAFPRALFFIPGIVTALYEDKLKPFKKYFSFTFLSLIAFLLLWRETGVDAAEYISNSTIPAMLGDARGLFILPALIVGFYMFVGVVFSQCFVGAALKTKCMQFFGNISYAFYLWSPVAMMVCKMVSYKIITPIGGPTFALIFFVVSSFVSSTLLAWINRVFIEKRLTGFIKNEIAKRQKGEIYA